MGEDRLLMQGVEGTTGLSQNEERLRMAMSVGGMAAWETNLTTGENFWDDNLAAMFGLPAAQAAAPHRSWLEFVHPSDRSRVQAEFGAASEDFRSAFKSVFRIVKSDGSERWFQSQGMPVQKEGVRFMVGLVQDVTERQRVETEIAHGFETLQLLINSVPAYISYVDSDERYQLVNRQYEKYFGVTAGDMIGKRVRELQSREAYAEMEPYVRAALAGKSVHYQSNPLGPDGQRHWFDVQYIPRRQRDGTVSGFFVLVFDITDRKQAEASRQESEERLRAFLESSAVIAWLKDEQGRHVFLSENCQRRLGMFEEDWKGKTDFELWPREIAEEFRRNDLAALASDRPIEVVECTTDPNGGKTWWLSHKFSFRDASGKRYAGGLSVDITERERAKEELAHAKSVAEDANRAKDHFLAVLGHELRNPLTPIRHSVAILRHTGLSDPALQRVRDMIDRQVTQMTRLTDDLLDLSRIGQGKITLRKEEFDVVKSVEATIEDHRAALDAAGLLLDFQAPSKRLWLLGDPARLTQIVGNLLNNAVKFTERGGRVTIKLGTTPDTRIVISVVDTGIGMDTATLADIFEPFSQADRTIDRSRGGLGLGLALVKGLVELHGGTVYASSPGLGHGAQFVITLPGIKTPAVNAEFPQSVTRLRNKRILVIEDNVDVAESLGILLELNGHSVQVAKSGVEGLQLARAHRPEVIICDIGLPGSLDGYGVARAIRADAELKSLYLVAMTGYGQDEDRKRAKDAGFDQHLAKPADPEELERLLQK